VVIALFFGVKKKKKGKEGGGKGGPGVVPGEGKKRVEAEVFVPSGRGEGEKKEGGEPG